jgi:hypothetical protein
MRVDSYKKLLNIGGPSAMESGAARQGFSLFGGWRRLGALLVFCAVSASTAGAAPVGMVTDLTGKVWVSHGAEGSARQPLTILSYVSAGMLIEVDKGASVSVTLYIPPDEYAFVGPAKFRADPQGLSKLEGKAPVILRLGELAAETTSQAIHQGSRRTLAVARLRNTIFAPFIVGLSPDKTAVRSTSPRFTWNALPGIESYRVALHAGDGTSLLEESVSDTEWSLPPGYGLTPDRSYAWSVEATPTEGRTLRGQARFSVLEAAVAARLEAEAPKRGASFADRLRHALTLEALGLSEESRALWRDLARERPGEPAVQERAQP